MAYEAKTKPREASAAEYLQAIADPQQRADGEELLALFEHVTGEPATMWGPSIVGFGSYSYTYASGHSGKSAKTGFAVRSTGLVIYLCPGFALLESELSRLGPHKLGKGCLYLKHLKQIDRAALATMIRKSMEETDRRYPPA